MQIDFQVYEMSENKTKSIRALGDCFKQLDFSHQPSDNSDIWFAKTKLQADLIALFVSNVNRL